MLDAMIFFNKSDIPSLPNRSLKLKIKIQLSITDDIDICVLILWRLNIFGRVMVGSVLWWQSDLRWIRQKKLITWN